MTGQEPGCEAVEKAVGGEGSGCRRARRDGGETLLRT